MLVLTNGQTVAEMGVIRGEPHTASAQAGLEGARLFVLPAEAFKELLQRSGRFSLGWIADLAERLAVSSPVLAKR